MKAMILAAGRGKRMGALTDNMPKPLLQAGAHTLIGWQLMRLAQAGFTEVVINLGYRGGQIREALGTGSAYGVHILYSREPEEGLETAGGIIQALPLLGEHPFLIINADVWCTADYRRFAAEYHRDMLGHLLLTPTPDWKDKGDFDLAGEKVIQGSTLTFCGVSVLHPRLFAGSAGGFLPLAPFLYTAAAQGLLTGRQNLGFWQDIGTPERLAALRRGLS